jgi:diguanylate cyclase
MVSSTLVLVLGGCVLGIIQLLAGIGIGIWLRRDETAAAHRGQQDWIRASQFAKRLQALAKDVSTSVGEHAQQIEQASQQLAVEGDRTGESLAELVVDVIDDMVRANHSLKSKLDSAESRLQEQAVEIEAHISRSLTDALTGLPNRREFNERLEQRMGAWQRRKEAFSLLLLDVDHFKRLNDQHGHLVGDRVLAGIGRALRAVLRREDSVARYGGEEFAVLLPSTTLAQAEKVAQKIRNAIAGVVLEHNGHRIAVTASGGLAMIGGDKEASESLIQRADAALYAAKAAGRNRAFIHDGTACRPASGNPPSREKTSPPRISATPVESKAASESQASREEISAELAQTCEELRRFVEERGQQQPQAS